MNTNWFNAMKPGWLLTALLLILLQACGPGEEEMIRQSVIRHMEIYPASTLQDLYKSYFQDYFGPGHMIGNPEAAWNYLEYELAQDDYTDTVLLFPTGYKGNFVRVNLELIRNGTLPATPFMEEFIKLTNAVTGISMEEWKREWARILAVIEDTSPGLPGFKEDRRYLDSLLANGEYVVHHSQLFLETYHPHYRIIQKELFEKNFSKYLVD